MRAGSKHEVKGSSKLWGREGLSGRLPCVKTGGVFKERI